MILYRVLRFGFSIYLRIVHRLIIRGRERVPVSGPAIICANHTSYLDAMLMSLCTSRQVRFMVFRDFYEHPFLGFIIRRGGGIPVSQNGTDAEAFKTALGVLKQGEVLGIFPEGKLSRTGLPSTGRPGAALFAALSRAPLVPVTIAGAFFIYPKGRMFPRLGGIRITIHAPIFVDLKRKKDHGYLQDMTDRLMMRIGKRVRGYYRVRGKKRRAAKPKVHRHAEMRTRATARQTHGGTV